MSPEIDNSYAINSSSNTFSKNGYNFGMYENYILKELIPYLESNYSVITTRDGRYAGGISMGGFVALNLGFTHPDLFSKLGGHSAALWKNQSDIPTELSWLTKTNMELFSVAQHQNLTGISVYLDHGDMDHDWLIQGESYLNDILQTRGIKTELHTGKGGHDYSNWGAHADDYLMFYAGNH